MASYIYSIICIYTRYAPYTATAMFVSYTVTVAHCHCARLFNPLFNLNIHCANQHSADPIHFCVESLLLITIFPNFTSMLTFSNTYQILLTQNSFVVLQKSQSTHTRTFLFFDSKFATQRARNIPLVLLAKRPFVTKWTDT